MLIFMENEKATPFGERLKWARKQAKLTQKVAAKKVGMSQGTLAELEGNGQGSSYTPALAALYNVNSVWLATGKGDPLNGQEPFTIDMILTEVPTTAVGDKSNAADRVEDLFAADIVEFIEAYKSVDSSRRTLMMQSIRAISSGGAQIGHAATDDSELRPDGG